MAETTTKTKRDMAMERLKSRYPDREFADDEAVFGQINDDYADYDNRIAGYQEREKKFSDMFTSDPRSARFLKDWKDGGDPVLGLVRQFGTDIKDAIDDPARQEEIAAANKEFVERVAKEKELEETYQQNFQKSLEDLDKYQQESGLSDDAIDEAMGFIVNIVKDAVVGKFTTQTIQMAAKALHHDADVQMAGEDGEVRGRNAKIDERLRKRSQGDGVSALDGQNRPATPAKPQRSLGALERASDEASMNIWERGGENRRKRSVLD